MSSETTQLSIPIPHRHAGDFNPHRAPSPALASKEPSVKRVILPDWIWQSAIGVALAVGAWAHGKLQGIEVGMAQTVTRVDALESKYEKIDSKMDKMTDKIDAILQRIK